VPDDIEKEEKSGRVHEINVDNYVRCAGRTGIPLEYSIERWTTDKALEFLENKDSEKPFFLWLTYDRPHAPHGVSEPYDKIYDPDKISLLPHETLEQICSKPYDYFAKLKNFFGDDTKLRRVLAAYYSIITCIDDEIGRVVQYLKDKGIYDDTTVIFTADHGDMAGMHGSFEKDNMTEEVIKIPLIIKPACQDSIDIPEKVNEPCESVDIMPSLLSLHNLNKLDISAGRDISGIFKGKKLYEHRSVFSEQYSIKVIIKDGWKLVYYLDKPYGMLFDLNNDPCETTNLYEDDKYRSKRLELKNELIKKLADGWDDQDVEDVENTIFNLGGRSSKVHYGNIGWDQSRFYVVDYRCMYVVEDNPAKYIMMYKLYDDQVLVYPVVNGCPDYTSGDHKKMMIDNGRYEKFVDALADWLICKITPIDVIGVQASELPDAYPDEAEVSKFLSSLSKRESIQKGSVG
jgi:hypothetical protein